MKPLLMIGLVSLMSMSTQTAFAKTLEVEVHGMTCAFCVYSLERKLTETQSITNVQVSLKTNKVRLETDSETVDVEDIKRSILDAGFTPLSIKVLNDENSKEGYWEQHS
ncbi:MAG: heavy-metal-associated domain-containing protein [Pseudomonadales bacterium]|nr:heavy-metal-associated domain-containing protein [Pseudomonadales bacterium]